MKERNFTLILGIVFVLLGLAGFVPGLVSMPAGAAPNIPLDAPSVTFDEQYGYLFGLFPTNLLHNLVHVAVGLLGIASSTNTSNTRLFNRSYAIVYALMAFMGLFPYGNTMFGLMPIHGYNIWFNAVTAVAAAYYGFVLPTQVRDMEASPSS